MVLAFEAITCGLAIPVAANVAASALAVRLLTFFAIMSVLTAGVLRRPGGFVIAWSLQVGLLLTVAVVPAFGFVAVPFVALWWYCLRIGARIDREREQLHGSDAPVGSDVP